MDFLKAKNIAKFIESKTNERSDVAVVLGSGLSGLCEQSKINFSISYKDIPNFPFSTVKGHSGRLVFAEINSKKVIFMQGRVHYYEGYSMEDVVLPFVVLKLLGVEKVILTNSAGGINENFDKGCLMQITDQITSFVPSPLVGENFDELGVRFPDMTEVYDRNLIKIIKEVGIENGIRLEKGVYLQTSGPNFETPAEIQMFKKLGADAVGMSTACEAMVCNYMGIKVAGISLISNMASGLSGEKLSHEEVLESGEKLKEKFGLLIKESICKI